MVAPPAYKKYKNELKKGVIAHLDRVKINVLKNRLDLPENWWKSSIFCNDHGHPKKRFWNVNKLPDDLRGTRLTVRGNNFIVELHNVLNRFPSINIMNMYSRVLGHLKENEIFNNEIEEVSAMATATEIEIRFDFVDGEIYQILSCRNLSDKIGDTLYFTKPRNFRLRKSRGRLEYYMYPKGEHIRFEIVLTGRSISKLYGTPKEIIPKLNIESSLRTRFDHHQIIWPVIKNHTFFEDYPFDFEELFKLSLGRNQHTKKWI